MAGFSKNKYDIYQSDMKSERDILMMMQDQKEQGRAEGRTEGRVSGIAESIIKLLEDHGKISEDLQTKIMAEKDLQVLSKWLKLAARVDSIDVFQARM